MASNNHFQASENRPATRRERRPVPAAPSHEAEHFPFWNQFPIESRAIRSDRLPPADRCVFNVSYFPIFWHRRHGDGASGFVAADFSLLTSHQRIHRRLLHRGYCIEGVSLALAHGSCKRGCKIMSVRNEYAANELLFVLAGLQQSRISDPQLISLRTTGTDLILPSI